MSGTLRFPLEAFKFSLYLSIPVIATIVYADPSNMERIVDATKYIIYPKEAPRPPIGDEINDTVIFQKLKAHQDRSRSDTAATPPTAAKRFYFF